jgi:hypothetical protein
MVNGKRDRFLGGSHDSMADAKAALYEARRVELGLDPDPQQCEKSYHSWTSKYIGVYQQESRRGRWPAQIKVGAGRSMILGYFDEADEEGAARLYAAARAARDALREAGVPDEEIVKVLNLKTRRAPHEPPLVPEALIARCGEHGVVLAQDERGCWNGPASPRAAVVDLPSAEDGLWRHESVGVHWIPAVWVAGLTVDGNREYLGGYDTEAEAEDAVRARRVELGWDLDPQPTSGFTGVHWDKSKEKWSARVSCGRRRPSELCEKIRPNNLGVSEPGRIGKNRGVRVYLGCRPNSQIDPAVRLKIPIEEPWS